MKSPDSVVVASYVEVVPQTNPRIEGSSPPVESIDPFSVAPVMVIEDAESVETAGVLVPAGHALVENVLSLL